MNVYFQTINLTMLFKYQFYLESKKTITSFSRFASTNQTLFFSIKIFLKLVLLEEQKSNITFNC